MQPKIEDIGLSSTEAKTRLQEFGSNQIAKPHKLSFFGIAKEEVTEPMILLLLGVGFFYAIWGNIGDTITVFGIITIVVLVEVWNEYRAKKAIAALSKMASPKARVLRDSSILEIDTEQVVPDDILVLMTGTRISADCQVIASFSLQVDESSLTGESFPQEKKVGDKIYAGTLVLAGEGKGKVTTTGKNTKMGTISVIAQQIKEPKTSLQLAMKSLAKRLVIVALVFSAIIPLVGYLQGQNVQQMILTGLALAFATIPEDLPVIVTVILGLGAYMLSKRNLLVKKIKAAEVLGNITVIVTDKTGTITENKMRVVSVYPKEREIQIFNAAHAATTEISLDPTDESILERVRELKLERRTFGEIARERSFGNGRKTRSILYRSNNGLELFMSGSPEEVLGLSKYVSKEMEDTLTNETEKGRRVIAVAKKLVARSEEDLPFPDLERGLDLAGLISLEDPPRKEARETIDLAMKAGIRTVMVTGDHPQTASFIANTVGIDSKKTMTGNELDRLSDVELQETVRHVSVFARTTPQQKYKIVKAFHGNKDLVAVTGDGVNDTLALKEADVGIAMGVKGTDAAKEAADAVLTDDNFVKIIRGIFDGRKFSDNFRKGVKYYLSTKVALVMMFLAPLILNIHMPFAPIQIILLELFMDLATSVVFVAEPAEKTIYSRPPRDPREKFLNDKMIRDVAYSSLSLFVAVFVSYYYALWQNLPLVQAQTFAFTAWIIGHVILAIVSRSEKEPLSSIGLFSNRIMNLWAVAVFVFIIVVIGMPFVNAYLKLSFLTLDQIGIIIGICILTIFWQEIRKVLALRKMVSG